jgi:threonine/homoserine/homoserine lactone efflux protein
MAVPIQWPPAFALDPMPEFSDFAAVHSLLLFATTVLVVNATPGADMLLTFTNTMRHGVRGGVATALGIGAGSLLHTAFVAAGVAALLQASPVAYHALLWVGAVYLVWIAFTLVREGLRVPVAPLSDDEVMARMRGVGFDAPVAMPGASMSAPRPAPESASTSTSASPSAADRDTPTAKAAAARGPFLQGFVTNATNPKVALFFLALLPQFVEPAAPTKWPALVLLGVWFAAQGTLFLVLFVRVAAVLRRWEPTPARRRALYVVAAAALLLVALRLVVVGPAAP